MKYDQSEHTLVGAFLDNIMGKMRSLNLNVGILLWLNEYISTVFFNKNNLLIFAPVNENILFTAVSMEITEHHNFTFCY